jgi:threonine dehydratase
MIPADWLQLARERIRPHTVRTPLTYDARNNLYLKWENHQVTGSFKPRGALNKVLSLEDWERKGGLVAASAGNHGQGVALAASLTQTRAEVFVPVSAPSSKVEAIRALGGEVIHIDGGYGETERAAKRHAEAHGRVFISPYNDGQVIAGQGTIALEIIEQLREQFQVDPSSIPTWVLPTGGGGLISGCGAALASSGERTALVGVQPEASAFTFNLLRGGSQAGVIDGATLAEGLSGAIDEDSITIPMMRRLIQEIVTVTEDAIARAIAHAWWTHRERIEGSAAAALAAALDGTVRARPAVVVLTGGNIETDVFERIVAQYPLQVRA